MAKPTKGMPTPSLDPKKNGKKKKKRKVVPILLLCFSALLVGAVGGYALAPLFRKPQTTEPVVPPTPLESFINNLMSDGNVSLYAMDVNVSGFDQRTSVHLSSTNASVSYKSLLNMGTSQDPSGVLSGDFTLSVSQDQTEKAKAGFSAYATTKTVSLAYRNETYAIDVSSLGQIVNVVTGFLPTANGSDASSGLSHITQALNDALASAKTTPVDGGYDFEIATPYGDVVLKSDEDGHFRGLDASKGLTVPVNGARLFVTATAYGTGSGNATVTDAPATTQDMNGIAYLATAIGDVNRAKRVDAKLSYSFEGNQKPAKAGELRFAGDWSDSDRLRFKAQSLPTPNGYIQGDLEATYDGDKTYLLAGTGIKGYVDNSKAKDLITDFFGMTASPSTGSVLDAVGTLFKGDLSLSKLLGEGNFDFSQSYIKAIRGNDKRIQVDLYASAIGLSQDPKAVFSLIINYHKDGDAGVFDSLQVTGLPVLGQTFGLTLTLDDFQASHVALNGNPSDYAEYNGFLPLANSLAKIGSEKKASFDFSFVSQNAAEGFGVGANGQLAVDATHYVPGDMASVLNVEFALDSKINAQAFGLWHNFDVRKIGTAGYVSYDDVMMEKMEDTETLQVMMAFEEGLRRVSGNALASPAGAVAASTRIASAVDIAQTLDLDALTQIFYVDPNKVNGTKANVMVNLDKLGFDGLGTLSFDFDTADKDILSLSVTGLEIDGSALSFALTQHGTTLSPRDVPYFGDRTFDPDDFAGKEVTRFHYFVTGIFDLFDPKKKYGVTLNAAYGESRVKGFARIDPQDAHYDGQLILDIDSHNYDPALYFNADGDDAKAIYTHVNSDGKPDKASHDLAGIDLSNASLSDAFQSVANQNGAAVLGLVLSRVSSGLASVPILKAIQSHDYSILFSNLVQTVDVTDTELDIGLNPSLLGLDANGYPMTIRIRYDGMDGGRITGIALENASAFGKPIDFVLERDLYWTDDVYPIHPGFFDGTVKWIDLSLFPFLLQLGLNTLAKTSFLLNGSFRAILPVISDIQADMTMAVNLVPESGTQASRLDVYASLTIGSSKTEYAFSTNDDAIRIRKGNVAHKINRSEFWSHPIYYVLGMGLDFEGEDVSDPIGYRSLVVEKADPLVNANAISSKPEGGSGSGGGSGGDVDLGGIFGTAFFPEDWLSGLAGLSYDPQTLTHSMDLGPMLNRLTLPKGLSFGPSIDLSISNYGASQNNQIKTVSLQAPLAFGIADSVSIGLDIQLTNAVASVTPNEVTNLSFDAVHAYYESLADIDTDFAIQSLQRVRHLGNTAFDPNDEGYWKIQVIGK